MSRPPQQNASPALEDMLQFENLATQKIPPTHPSKLVDLETLRREYDDYMCPEVEDGATAHPKSAGFRPGQDIVANSTNILPNVSTPFQTNSTKTTPFNPDIRNSTPHNNKVSPRESDVLATIAREEISKQLNPLVAGIEVLKREICSRLDPNIENQNKLLIRLYQQKAFHQAIKVTSTTFDGKDLIKYGPWKKDLQNEIRDLALTASQELQLLESRTELEPLQIVKNVKYVKYEISDEFALQMAWNNLNRRYKNFQSPSQQLVSKLTNGPKIGFNETTLLS